jgi:hypothetical protein
LTGLAGIGLGRPDELRRLFQRPRISWMMLSWTRA